MPETARIRVTVACAAPQRVFLREIELPAIACVIDAIEASCIRDEWPELEIRADRIGIFARKADFDTALRDGDRVEIYRPLKIDPKEARRRRAKSDRSANERK